MGLTLQAFKQTPGRLMALADLRRQLGTNSGKLLMVPDFSALILGFGGEENSPVNLLSLAKSRLHDLT